MSIQIIATAADQHKFEDATVYTATYVGSQEMDANVNWKYIRMVAQANTGVVICRNRDGSDASRRTA